MLGSPWSLCRFALRSSGAVLVFGSDPLGAWLGLDIDLSRLPLKWSVSRSSNFLSAPWQWRALVQRCAMTSKIPRQCPISLCKARQPKKPEWFYEVRENDLRTALCERIQIQQARKSNHQPRRPHSRQRPRPGHQKWVIRIPPKLPHDAPASSQGCLQTRPELPPVRRKRQERAVNQQDEIVIQHSKECNERTLGLQSRRRKHIVCLVLECGGKAVPPAVYAVRQVLYPLVTDGPAVD